MIAINNHAYGYLLAARTGGTYSMEADTNISRTRDDSDELLGGAIFSNYTGDGGSLCIHFAGLDPRWLNRDILWTSFHYCFVQLGCRKIFGQIRATNEHSLKVTKKLGFSVEAQIKDAYPDGDMVLLSMYKEHCRWLGVAPRSIKEAA